MEIVNTVLGWVGVALLTSFIPLTAYSFYCYRRDQKCEEYNRIIEALGYHTKNAPAYVPSINKEFERKDYYLPVAFASVITFLGAMVLIQGPSLVGEQTLSLLLEGPTITSHKLSEGNTAKLVGMLVIALSFTGAYIWSAQSLYRRLSTLDLPPSTYYGIGVRMLFSVFVSLMIYYLFPLENGAIKHPAILAVTVFISGMFPERALRYLQEKARIHPTNDQAKAHPLPLAMIQGVQLFERVRLAEIGIDNAQNLAKANFIEVLLRTPFNPREVIDWIGQARLYLFFTDEIAEMRKAGVRTIFDFKKMAQTRAHLDELAKLTGISIEKLDIVTAVLDNDPDIARLEHAIAVLLGPTPPTKTTAHNSKAVTKTKVKPKQRASARGKESLLETD